MDAPLQRTLAWLNRCRRWPRSHIAGFERDQLLSLPEAVDDYVGSDNPVRFIDEWEAAKQKTVTPPRK